MKQERKSKTKSKRTRPAPDQPCQVPNSTDQSNKEKVLPDIRLLFDDNGSKHFLFP